MDPNNNIKGSGGLMQRDKEKKKDKKYYGKFLIFIIFVILCIDRIL